jgi:tetratricopeptide (TPR) repeat protein
MDAEFPLGKYENWTECQNLFPHVEKALEYRPANQDYLQRWASILFNAGWYADEKGNYGIAEKMRKQAADAYKKTLGPEHPSTLSSMANLATTYRKRGRWKEAEELDVRVVETRKTVLGQQHPETLTSMNNLASTYWSQGRWRQRSCRCE